MKAKLSARLEAVCAMVPPGFPAADVGCDHAWTAIALVERGIVPCAAASDIRSGPLEAAASHVGEAGLLERIAVCRADGVPEDLRVLLASRPGYREPVTVITAGMGGILMTDILRRAFSAGLPVGTAVVSPQRDAAVLRHFLTGAGWRIDDERLVADRGKRYPVIRAVKSGAVSRLSEAEAGFGPVLLRNRDEETGRLIRSEWELTEKILASLAEAHSDERQSARAAELLRRRAVLEEAEAFYRQEHRIL